MFRKRKQSGRAPDDAVAGDPGATMEDQVEIMSTNAQPAPVPPARRLVDIPPAPRPSTPRRETPGGGMTRDNQLTVGRDIRLKGEIADCDVLVVEGEVEAGIVTRLMEIAETGVFNGNAQVETAEIRGRFDGELVATDLLRIHEQGMVRGKIRYARLEIMSGGQISGDIQATQAFGAGGDNVAAIAPPQDTSAEAS